MTTPDPARERELFDAALELSAAERAAFLAGLDPALRSRLERLLRAFAKADAVGELGPLTPFVLTDEFGPGTRIGPYRIVSELGSGGMGTVHLAEQLEPVRRTVALKIVKLGMDTREVLARFHAERQALARMTHPNIAQIYDAGATERGRPYFVMEHVAGEPIHRHCDSHGLDARQRIRLFLSVCDGVEHAHQKGVIHRDLKPSNILVTIDGGGKPQVKVIDFGIAKATTADGDADEPTLTGQGQVVGTPRYMSPEQAGDGRGAIDTRSDVYSLGVVLYELLTGTLPFDFDDTRGAEGLARLRTMFARDPRTPSASLARLGDVADQVARARSTTLRSLRRSLQGEIEWILLRALAREPERRYQSVGAFAQDLQRLLDGLPVDAGPPSELYRLRKTLQRHRYSVAFAGTVIALIAVQVALIVRHSRELATEADRANAAAIAATDAAETSGLITDFVKTMLESATPEVAQGDELTVREILERSERLVDDAKLAAKPPAEAGIRRLLGRAYLAIGRPMLARPHLEQALALHQRLTSPAIELVDSHLDVADALFALAENAAVEPSLTAATTLFPDLPVAARAPFEARHLEILANLRYRQDRRDEALGIRRQLVAHLDATPTADPVRRARALSTLSFGLIEAWQLDDVESLLRRGIDLLGATGHDRHPEAVRLRELLGWLFTRQTRIPEAIAEADAALDLARAIYAPNHPRLADVLNTSSAARWRSGDHDTGEAHLRECIAIRRTALGDHHDTALALEALADVLIERGAIDEAETFGRECLAIRERAFGPDSLPVAMILYRLARIAEARDDVAESTRLALASLANWDIAGAASSRDTAEIRILLARQLTRSGDMDQAITEHETAVRSLDATLTFRDYDRLLARQQLIDLYLDAERFEPARAVVVETRDGAQAAALPPTIALFAYMDIQHGAALAGLGRHDEARPLALEGWDGVVTRDSLPKPMKYRLAELVRRVFEAAGDEAGASEWAATRDGYRD